MNNCMNKIKLFLADEQGAEIVEWVMIASVLAAIILVVFWTTLQGSLNTAIVAIGTKMATH